MHSVCSSGYTMGSYPADRILSGLAGKPLSSSMAASGTEMKGLGAQPFQQTFILLGTYAIMTMSIEAAAPATSGR